MITAEELARSPAWFPLELAAQGSVRLIRLSESAYRAASFLDQRILGTQPEQAICDVGVLEAAARQLAPRSHYIFHIGHVGSTLVSRLLGEHRHFFSLREPALLRAMTATRPLPLGTLLRLLARTWRAEQRAVIKPTSFLSELISPILQSSEAPAAIFMYAQRLAYLRGILGGPNSRIEARTLAPSRLQRLARRLGPGEWQAQVRTEGESLAMSWLCEMAALHQAAEAARPGSARGAQLLWVDFDELLADPASVLSQILRMLGASPTARECEALASGPVMHQYSKAPEHAYDAELRREVLAAADRQHGVEIARGMRWLDHIATQYPLVAQILDMK